MRDLLIKKVNKSNWWHVPPRDPHAYEKRGKFLASTYLQAEFYGRPNIEPEQVCINNPVYGFSELEILKKLFGSNGRKYLNEVIKSEDDKDWYNKRIELDRQMFLAAKTQGYDAIILMTETGRNSLQKGRKPNSIELNLIEGY
ncbi:MAG TPA: hypothetical protein DCR71_02820 [Dehalococcoidia bacterium]|nr:hypothetical protein [Dehalococcoidia bacterium]